MQRCSHDVALDINAVSTNCHKDRWSRFVRKHLCGAILCGIVAIKLLYAIWAVGYIDAGVSGANRNAERREEERSDGDATLEASICASAHYVVAARGGSS